MKAHQRIRAYRQAHNISADDLAKKLGISRSTLRSIENGNRPVVPKMAVVLEREIGIPRAQFCPEIFEDARA